MRTQGSILRRAAVAAVASVKASAIVTLPAVAQDVSTVAGEADAPAMPACMFRQDPAGGEQAQILLANCRGRGVVLGPATDYSVARNDDIGSTIVDIRFAGNRRILMLTPQDDGEVLVEDLGGQIAMAAGRGALSDIADLEIGLEGFAEGGILAVRSDEDARQQVKQLDLGQQVAAERQRRQLAAGGS